MQHDVQMCNMLYNRATCCTDVQHGVQMRNTCTDREPALMYMRAMKDTLC